jgi:hypothetical protein
MTNTSKEILESPDGTVINISYQEGCIHDVDGAAWTLRTKGGLTIEFHFQNGKLECESGPAISVSHPDGSGAEGYFVDGRHVGPKEIAASSKVAISKPLPNP